LVQVSTSADLFSINTDNLKYANGTDSVKAQYAGRDLSYLVKTYTVQNGANTVLMMSIPEPSTYGLGLGALALAAVAIRRRKQKKATV
jgi:ethanolamine utilization microcompartment shell protein EutL